MNNYHPHSSQIATDFKLSEVQFQPNKIKKLTKTSDIYDHVNKFLEENVITKPKLLQADAKSKAIFYYIIFFIQGFLINQIEMIASNAYEYAIYATDKNGYYSNRDNVLRPYA